MFKITLKKESFFSAVGFFLLILLCQIKEISEIFVWSKDALITKEYWRIPLGNFTHTNISHLLLNCISFFLITSTFKPKIKEATLVVLFLSLSVGILMFYSDTYKYAGLSGIIHGYFIYLCAKDFERSKVFSVLLGSIAIIKVANEKLYGASEMTQELINAPVAVDAHMYGLISGVALFFIVFVVKQKRILN